VVYRLVRSIGDANMIESAVNEILSEVITLSSKLALITYVGYRENAGHKLVSETAAAEFERNWRSEVRAAAPSDLEREKDLLRVLIVTTADVAGGGSTFQISDMPTLTLAILRAARTEVKSQAFGSRAIQRSSRIQWSVLTELFGSEEELRRRIDRLKESKPQGEDELLSLVDKYLGGWRPEMGEA
jgi:hypothetical protein